MFPSQTLLPPSTQSLNRQGHGPTPKRATARPTQNYDDFSTVNDIAILKLSRAYTKCPAVIAAVATIATQAV